METSLLCVGAQESQYLSAYCAAFNSAIKLEMKEEEEAIHSRINTWTKEDLEESGLALFGLSVSHSPLGIILAAVHHTAHFSFRCA